MSAPLAVRLPNHLGDTLMTLPALERLAAAGHALELLGKGWAKTLLGAYEWPLTPAAPRWTDSIAQWRAQRAAHGPQALLLTNSFGTALAARLGGMRATGYATDGRGLLLARAVPVPESWSRADGRMHTVEYYDALAAAFLHEPPRRPPPLALRLRAEAHAAARALLAGAGVSGPYVVLCPGATGLHHGREKTWRDFPRLTHWLLARGERVVGLPGPGERPRFEQALPGAVILPEADVATYAALLAASRLVVANDSGPSHLAAAVGAPLLALFGVTEVVRTRPWSEHATVLGSAAGWPSLDEVRSAAERRLAGAAA
jgi:heptosyltransferase-2